MKEVKSDAAYISYVESGESAAVFITRDLVRDIDTTGMWIDIIDMDGHKNKNNRWEFKYFIFELFPREMQPEYPKDADEEERAYITWWTANEDIKRQRRRGYKGAVFIVWPKLNYYYDGKWEYDIRYKVKRKNADKCCS